MRLVVGDRVAAVGLLLLAAFVALEARTFTVGFLADPLGPRAIPYLVAGFLFISGVRIYLRPGKDPEWPSSLAWRRVMLATGALAVYGLMIEPLGFVLATISIVTVLSLIFGGRWSRSLAAAVAFTGALYVLFMYLLGIPLPIGDLLTVSG